MYIKEVTIDGFKSYAQRVCIPGFDQQFNAITGLNGSGKSNILDSICFVLGIQNLQQVRANSLQELVYKQGQAGITKATVSIVFNNEDKGLGKSPVGYEHLDEITVTRQLVIGGRSKYLINGKLAEPSRVQNLFHSVQLNVNNPHFLIMQGRITKVLNMKPPEILGLLEEAAGTKMYESKKQAALRTLEKKQIKLDEIIKVLQHDIMPALDKLRKEKMQYNEWQNARDSVDKLCRFCVAFRYVESEKLQDQGEREMKAASQHIDELTAQIASMDLTIREKDDEIQGLQAEKELQSGGEVKELMQHVDDLSKKLVKDTCNWNNKKEMAEDEKANCNQISGDLAELNEEEMIARVQQATQERAAAQEALDKAVAGVEASKNELAGAETGDGRDESNRTLQQRLADCQHAQTEAQAEVNQKEMRIKCLKKLLSEQQKKFSSNQEGSKLQSDLDKERAAIEQCSQRLSGLGYDRNAAQRLKEDADKAEREMTQWRDRVNELSGKLAGINFQYRDPEPNFDRSRVKGVVARLVRVKDPATSTAVEVAAGSKLYQVVVDSEQTSKALVANGQLRSRVTIIPLNKVSSRGMHPNAVAAARRMFRNNAQPALELVGYDQELFAAMNYIFGCCLICKDAAIAKKLAFSREVNIRCVTMEGDDFNPGGTLTGGAHNKGGSVLARLQELREAEEQLQAKESANRECAAALAAMSTAASNFEKLSEELEVHKHSLSLLENHVRNSEAHHNAEAVAATEAELAEAQQDVQDAEERKQRLVTVAKELENEIANFGKDRDKRIKMAKDKLKAAKAEVEKAQKELKNKQTALQTALAEAETAEGQRANVKEKLEAAKASLAELEKSVAELAAVVVAGKTEFDENSSRLEGLKARLKECDKEIVAATKERSKLEQKKMDLVVEKKKLGNKLEGMRKGIAEAVDRCKKLEKEYSWIPSEKHHFGKPGTDYDWQAKDSDEVFAEYERANATVDVLSKKVNKRVMQMFDKAEQEYNELKRKKDVVENDKRKIEEVMDELDEKKRTALEQTWLKVNEDFGSIFGTLLPGTTAKLEPQEGKSFLEGLEVRVAFGGVWKESLSELSGGQKSLLALSLILAMLLFKPAPIYILDEVDAALDLSHTQNIGRMIKQHFPQSQFIVVSLKEGMFNNANVIFRTKFVDGVSTVARTVNERREESSKAGTVKGRAVLRENVRV